MAWESTPKVLAAGRQGHFGPRGMRERAGGKLTVRSSAGAGAEAEMKLLPRAPSRAWD